jgi:alpha-glucoside transport system substrate-binding protein
MNIRNKHSYLLSSVTIAFLGVTIFVGIISLAPSAQVQASSMTQFLESAASEEVLFLPGVTNQSKNKSVNVFVGGGETSAQEYEEATDPFEQQTGINIIYEGSDNFEDVIVQRVQAGNPPDVAFFPQPGLLGNLVSDTIDLNDWFTPTYMLQQYNQSWLDIAEINGHMAGVWYRTSAKSLVWYPKDDFDAATYSIPTSWTEMIALSDQMVSDGRTPWCLGIASGPATGWVGTDWVEDIMLRTTSPENYDKWVNGEMKFSSTEVISAWQTMGEIWFADDYVLGGRQAITTTFFLNAMDPIYENPPGCWLHRQSMFIANSIPESAEFGIDVDYFYLPPIDSQYGDPVLVAGDIAAAFKDTAAIRDYISYLTTGESVKYFVELGTYLSPHKDTSLEVYPEISKGSAEILLNADTVRFDGSDLMPGVVGAGTFWEGIVDYVNGKDLTSIMTDIDSSWP